MVGGAGGTLAAKPANVRQVVAEARVVGTSQPQLNGKVAATATYDRASKRYRMEGLAGNGGVVAPCARSSVLWKYEPHSLFAVLNAPGASFSVLRWYGLHFGIP